MPYDLIVTSASRPHLLARTLRSLLDMVDVLPVRAIVHDDAAFPGRLRAIEDVVEDEVAGRGIEATIRHSAPSVGLGPALHWLLAQARTPYVLYSQDDHVAVRKIPVSEAIGILDDYGLHQIRFNKRTTMDRKGDFVKVEQRYGPATLCVADHWYFQTGVWRVSQIKPVVDWWYFYGPGAFSEHAEAKLNDAMNGRWAAPLVGPRTFPSDVYRADVIGARELWMDPSERARTVKTFIWGPVGEPPYIEHIGTAPSDWANPRANRDKA
jgi:hypothetical protein